MVVEKADKVEVMHIPEGEVQHWESLMSKEKVDYDQENLPTYSRMFVKTAKFDDGVLADLVVCTSGHNEDLFSELLVYDEHGNELWLSEINDGLVGVWEFELKKIYNVGMTRYKLIVTAGSEVYNSLGCLRDDLCIMVKQGLEDGISEEYSAAMADAIADQVAEDVRETADPKEWNSNDVKLGISRVLLKRLGISV